MSRDRGEDATEERGFDWGSPRWRESDATNDVGAGKRRRFRDAHAPEQSGAVDSPGSIPGGSNEARSVDAG